jgi:hypothetical protein
MVGMGTMGVQLELCTVGVVVGGPVVTVCGLPAALATWASYLCRQLCRQVAVPVAVGTLHWYVQDERNMNDIVLSSAAVTGRGQQLHGLATDKWLLAAAVTQSRPACPRHICLYLLWLHWVSAQLPCQSALRLCRAW